MAAQCNLCIWKPDGVSSDAAVNKRWFADLLQSYPVKDKIKGEKNSKKSSNLKIIIIFMLQVIRITAQWKMQWQFPEEWQIGRCFIKHKNALINIGLLYLHMHSLCKNSQWWGTRATLFVNRIIQIDAPYLIQWLFCFVYVYAFLYNTQ